MSITIVTGPPGAGKSTVAGILARSRIRGVHLVADQAFGWIVSGYAAPWLPGTEHQNGTVIAAVGAAAARFDEGGYDVVVDGIVGPWFLAHWLRAVGRRPTQQYVILRPSRQVALGRALRRTAAGDLVDPSRVSAMFDAFENLGVFESHVIDSSDQDAAATVEAVRSGVEAGLYALTSHHNADVTRLATKVGNEPTDVG